MDNISTVNGRTVSGIRSCNTSRDKYIISSAIFCCDSYTFIEETMKGFNRKTFAIAFSKDIIVKIQSLAHSNKSSLKRGIVIDYYKVTHPKFQQDMLHEITSQCSRSFVWDRNNHDELGHVVHGVHQCDATMLISHMSRRPQINVKYSKG